MSIELIEFYASDGATLNGYLNKGEQKTNKVLIELHGMTSNCFKKREMVISNYVQALNIDSICFNNRGSDIVRYLKYKNDEKVLAGTAYEDIEESYYDIIGVLEYAIELGYTDIYLQGHSLGATKIVYTYHRMQKEEHKFLKNIKGILLLSLVDIPDIFTTFSPAKFIKYAEEKEKEDKLLELMPKESFIHPISVKNFLKYVKYNKAIDFARYTVKEYEFEELNNIKIPLFMRWGDQKELIKNKAEDQVNLMNQAIKNPQKDIEYIAGANHTYSKKEEELASEICNFLKINN